jgi:hypothetical protein
MNRLNKTFFRRIVSDAGYTFGVSVMAKKQATVKETAAPANATSPARAAKPKTPRVTAAKHSKIVSTEPVPSTEPVLATEPVLTESVLIETAAVQATSGRSEEAIAKIAYSYWESRGYQGGSPLEDWARAEHEYRQSLAATRL